MKIEKLKLVKQVSQLFIGSDSIPIDEAIAFLQSAKGAGATHFQWDIIGLELDAFEARPMTKEELEAEHKQMIQDNREIAAYLQTPQGRDSLPW